MELRNAKFLENDLISGSDQSQDLVSMRDQPYTSSDRLVIIHNTPQIQTGVKQPIIENPQAADEIPVDEVILKIPEIVEQPVEQHDSQENVDSTLIRSTRERELVISSDYVVYFQEYDFNVGVVHDPETFSQAMSCKESNL